MKKSILLLVYSLVMSSIPILAQNIQLTVRYNVPLARYEVYALPSFTNGSFAWGPSQITIVVPAVVNNANLSITSAAAGSWTNNINTKVFAPPVAPGSDFHAVNSSGDFVSFSAGVERLIFTFTLPGAVCVDGVRLFNNGSDPGSSAPGMGGGDYRNSIIDATPAQRYSTNYDNFGTVCTEVPISCGCYNLTVSLNANCKFQLTRNLVSDGNTCAGAFVRVMDNDPLNGDIIDCAGVWTYGLFNPDGSIICWGKVTAEDKTPPARVCMPEETPILDCYDISRVLNNPLTIGVVGETASPKTSNGNKFTILNAEGEYDEDEEECYLPSTAVTEDAVENLGYAFFLDNCRRCGCRVTLRWTDKLVVYNCAQERETGHYAKITREWVATDCNGMSSTYDQIIYFDRPEVPEDFDIQWQDDRTDVSFGHNDEDDEELDNDTEDNNFDLVVRYNICNLSDTKKGELLNINNRELLPRDEYNYFTGGLGGHIDTIGCNYSVSKKDTEFPICAAGSKGVKVIRELYVLDWCTGETYTYDILIKIGDFEKPEIALPATRPYVSTGPMDCTASFSVTRTGLKNAFKVDITDNCSTPTISVVVKTQDRYLKGILVERDVWAKVDYAIVNNNMIGVPVGRHRMIVSAFDNCYNTVVDSFDFDVIDKIAPVMKCDDQLNVTMTNNYFDPNSGINLEAYARVDAEDIDEGTWDNCKMDWIRVRRSIDLNDPEMQRLLYAKGYDWDGDAAKKIEVGKDGVDWNGDGDIDDLMEKFVTVNGVTMTPALDYVEFFCPDYATDLNDKIKVELWGKDFETLLRDGVEAEDGESQGEDEDYFENPDSVKSGGNTNFCWMEILIEDKKPVVCYAPADTSIYCTDKILTALVNYEKTPEAYQDEIDAIFGTPNESIAIGCNSLQIKQIGQSVDIKCGKGKVIRTFEVSKATSKGVSKTECTQTINVVPVHEYNVCFPADESVDCKGVPDADTLLTDELGCDLLSVNVSDKRYSSTGDECYKIFRTYTVVNWCTFIDGCGDPMDPKNVYVIERNIFGNANVGKKFWLLTRDRDKDGNEEFWFSSTNAVPAESDDLYLKGDLDQGGISTARSTVPGDTWMDIWCSSNHSALGANTQDALPTSAKVNDNYSWEYTHSFMYTQIIKVYDNERPEVVVTGGPFCMDKADCTLSSAKFVINGSDCTDSLTLETQFMMVTPYDKDGKALAPIMYTASPSRFSWKALGDGDFEVVVKNLTEGAYQLAVVVRDACGNLSVASRHNFAVEDCKAPAPICINGLSTELMPGEDGEGMMVVWASDFIASPVFDCNGQGPATDTNGLKEIKKYTIERDTLTGAPNPANTSIVLTCDDHATPNLPVRIYAWDEKGNYDYCVTFIDVQDNLNNLCGSGSGGSVIAGTIATEGKANLQGASITLSGSASKSATTAANGSYAFVNLANGADFTITPQLDKNHLNGVSTFDLVLIQKHILNVQALNSPYKMIAADVNNSKSITTLDLIALRKLILNIDLHFANNTSWRFVDGTYQFSNPGNPWSAPFPEVVNINDLAGNVQANFIAIKIGDVNGSATVSNAASAELRDSRTLLLNAEEQSFQVGQLIQVPIKLKSVEAIQGWQYTLNWDPAVLSLEGVDHGLVKSEHTGVFANRGMLTTSWNDRSTALKAEEVLYTLTLRAKRGGVLSKNLRLNSALTQAEAYSAQDEVMTVQLNFGQTKMQDQLVLEQNNPNPFAEETSIAFYLPKAGSAVLIIRDVKGSLVYRTKGDYAKGRNQIILNKTHLQTSGVFYYTLQTDEFTETRKMILTSK